MFGSAEFSDIKVIKNQTIGQFEEAFSKVLDGLTGKSFKVNIKNLVIDEDRNESHVELTISSESPF